MYKISEGSVQRFGQNCRGKWYTPLSYPNLVYPILTLALRTIDVQNLRRIGEAVQTELLGGWYAPLPYPNIVCRILTLVLMTIDVQNFRRVDAAVHAELLGG